MRVSIETAVPTPHFAIPPYRVESLPGKHCDTWHYVANANGFNCLSFTDKPGAKFTLSLDDANEICRRWNAGEGKE